MNIEVHSTKPDGTALAALKLKRLIDRFDRMHVCSCGGVSCPSERRGTRHWFLEETLESPLCDCNCFNLVKAV